MKSLEELFSAAKQRQPGDETAPFGFASRVVANWKEVGPQESFYWQFQRMARMAAVGSWAVACVALVVAWQTGVLHWPGQAEWGDAFTCYYVDFGGINL